MNHLLQHCHSTFVTPADSRPVKRSEMTYNRPVAGWKAVGVTLWLSGLSCASAGRSKEVWVPPDALSCERDSDCVVREDEFGCCCSCSACHAGVYPFAISQRANKEWDDHC